MNVFALVGVVFLLSFLVESLTEYAFGELAKRIPALTPYSWALIYVAMVIGVIGSFVYNFDLLNMAGTFMGEAIPITVYGKVLTGMGIGRGSNYLHGLVMTYIFKKTDQT